MMQTLEVFGLPFNMETSAATAIRNNMTMNVTIPGTILCHAIIFKVGLKFPCGTEFAKHRNDLCIISMCDDKINGTYLDLNSS